MAMKAARIVQPNKPLEVQEIGTAKPKGTQILVKILSSAVCHSDIHLWEGGYECPGGELRLNLVSMPIGAYKLISSYAGTLSELTELVSLAQRGVIKPVISDRFKLDQATEALKFGSRPNNRQRSHKPLVISLILWILSAAEK
jgi:D-arabinose 1-dehydrogenase-like Zn-dependent alcohol dehydrogenase